MTYDPSSPDLSRWQFAKVEARGLLALVKSGEPIERVRAGIGTFNPYRRGVLLAFDCLRVRPGDRTTFTRELRGAILCLLKRNLPQARVAKTLGIATTIVSLIARDAGVRFSKIGRGRRLSPELKKQIMDAVKAGHTSAEMKREYGVDGHTVLRFRHELGDFEDRTYRKKLSASDLEKAEAALRSGEKWRSVAEKFGVTLATLQKRVPYRKRVTPEQEAAIVEAFRSGTHQVEICRDFGLGIKTIRKIRRKNGLGEIAHRLTPTEKCEILAAIRVGESNRAIAERFSCNRTRPWQMRRQEADGH